MKTFIEGLKDYLKSRGKSAISSYCGHWGFDEIAQESFCDTYEEVDFDKLCAEIDKFAEIMKVSS